MTRNTRTERHEDDALPPSEGIILTVTGIIALIHYVLRSSGKLAPSLENDTLSPRVELIVAIVLVVLGLPLLSIAFNMG